MAGVAQRRRGKAMLNGSARLLLRGKDGTRIALILGG